MTGCPDDDPDFFVDLKNETNDIIFYHSRGYQDQTEIGMNNILDWDPRTNENFSIMQNDYVTKEYDLENTTIVVYSFMFYASSTLEENDWETIRDEGLYEARFDLTYEELEAMDFEIVFTGE
ncbi:hypothetical protein GCM10009117_16370 [Gangjinia marincola]|uniref:Uncharacterized protein n=1 Tax=Gangjinia marincola TaxID=578463 RepID=A0ABN1MH96_9FLAO